MNHPNILVIGYGNSIRGDDGIGPAVATQVEAWNLPQVKSLCLHQLTPEIAAELAFVKYAIFVDAAVQSQSFKLSLIEPLNQTNLKWGHYLTPQSLLGLTQKLYETVPEAYLISVPGVNFELCDSLSPSAEEGVDQALKKIHQLINQFNN
jgi:hydrogenase maturation protease